MKPTLDPAIIALYFNLAAGEKPQLSYEEQRILKGCMESTFPMLRHEARRLSKKMPRPKKPRQKKKKTKTIIGAVILVVAILLLLNLLAT